MIECAEKVRDFSGLELPVRIKNPDPHVSQIHHVLDDGRDVFFFSNRDEASARDLQLKFSNRRGNPVIWDAESGQRRAISGTDGSGFSIHLQPMESKVIVFESSDTEVSVERTEHIDLLDITEQIQLMGDWQVEFYPASDGRKFVRKMEELVDFSLVKNDPEVSSFGGKIVYRNAFKYEPDSVRSVSTWLDLGMANGTVSLRVNGHDFGTSWYGKHRFEISDGLKAGINQIEVTVTTILANDLKSRTDLSAQKRWAGWYKEIPMGLEGPIQFTLEVYRSF